MVRQHVWMLCDYRCIAKATYWFVRARHVRHGAAVARMVQMGFRRTAEVALFGVGAV